MLCVGDLLGFIPFYNDTAASYWSKWFKRIYLWYNWGSAGQRRVCVCVCVRKSLMCFLNCLECRAASLAFKHSLNCNVWMKITVKITVVVNKSESVLRAKSTSSQVCLHWHTMFSILLEERFYRPIEPYRVILLI